LGVLQPFSDAVKLFSREQYFPLASNCWSCYFSPVFILLLSLIVWLLVPYFRGSVSFELGLLFFLRCTRLGVYIYIYIYIYICCNVLWVLYSTHFGTNHRRAIGPLALHNGTSAYTSLSAAKYTRPHSTDLQTRLTNTSVLEQFSNHTD
jgi:formate hydrogenlyase subunit 4